MLGFSINGNAGATFPAGTVTQQLGSATVGDIVVMHMNQPESGTATGSADTVAVVRDRRLAFGLPYTHPMASRVARRTIYGRDLTGQIGKRQDHSEPMTQEFGSDLEY